MSGGHGLGLVADVGGTNARFALVDIDGDRRHLIALEQLPCAEFPDFETTLASYLRRIGASPHHGVVAVAGAIKDERVHFTNLDWSISHDSLAKAGFPGVRLINDYAAQALALPLLGPERLCPIGPLWETGEGNLAVLGPGSGLGVAALVRNGREVMPIATEGGHVDFAPVDETDLEIWRILRRDHPRVSGELLLCGSGLVRLHNVMQELAGHAVESLPASEVTERALAGDRACRETLLRFCAILGSLAGNAALTLGATGGVFIAGGIAPRILSILKESEFRQRFEDKAPMDGYLAAAPTFVITDTNSALLGAASVIDTTH